MRIVILILMTCIVSVGHAADKLNDANGSWLVEQLSLIDQRLYGNAGLKELQQAGVKGSEKNRWVIENIKNRYQAAILGFTDRDLNKSISRLPQEWKLADDLRKKGTDPWSGLGLIQPEKWNANSDTFRNAVYLSRALTYTGLSNLSIQILEVYRGKIPERGLLKAWAAVAAGEAFAASQRWERVIAASQAGLDGMKEVGGNEYSGTSKNIDDNGEVAVLSYELARLKKYGQRQWDLERYGDAFILYRDAEQARRFDLDEAKAWTLYEKIRNKFPNTVLAEASEAYGIACLVAFAGNNYHERLAQRTNDACRRLENLTESFKEAKLNNVTEEIKKEQIAILAEQKSVLDALSILPSMGNVSNLAMERGTEFIARNPNGLYRGEVLIALGDLQWEVNGDSKSGYNSYRQARIWFEDSKNEDRKVDGYDVEPRLNDVSAPSNDMRVTDAWGNVAWVKLQPGTIINQRTAAWYLGYWRLRSALREMSCLIVLGEKEAALDLMPIIRSEDRFQQQLEAKGWPTISRRLTDDIKEGRFFATKEELSTFPPNVSPRLIAAELAYETERYDDAIRAYASIKSDYKGRLSQAATAYLDYHAAIAIIVPNRAKAIEKLNEIAALDPRVPTWSRAQMDLFVLTQTLDKDGGGSLIHLDDIIKMRPGTEVALQATFTKASFLAARGRDNEAKSLFLTIQKTAPNSWMAKGAERFLAQLSDKKQLTVKPK